jgi:hypothetical protein
MDREDTNSTPAIVEAYIKSVVKKVRYRKKVRQDVRAELEAHFEDALSDCKFSKEREQVATTLIAGFGDARCLAKLIRRGKKRCRPVWVKGMIRLSQAAGLCVLYVVLCTSRLYIGSPTIKVDTMAWLNESVREGRDESLNARHDLTEACALLGKEPSSLRDWPRLIRDMNEPQRQSVEAYLAENQPAFHHFRQAATKPHYWPYYAPAESMPERTGTGAVAVSGLMDTMEMTAHLSSQCMESAKTIRQLAFAMEYQIQWETQQGKIDQAVSDCVALTQCGRFMASTGLMIEELVGVAITALGHRSILHVLEVADVNETALASTYRQFDAILRSDTPFMPVDFERALIDDLVQRSFTDDGQGNGRMLSSGMVLAASTLTSWLKNLLLFDLPDRQEITQKITAFYDQVEAHSGLSPWQLHEQPRESEPTDDFWYMEILGPAFERIAQLGWRLKTDNEATLAILGIKHYQATQGALPSSLEALPQAGLVRTIPRDYYSDGPFGYKRTEDGFTLYSRGRDMNDDGGKPAVNEAGELKKYGAHGDWIYWPITR